MARLLVQLKLRLLTNALRSSTRAKVSFIISTTFAALAATGILVILAVLRGKSAPVGPATVIFAALACGWLVLPLLAFGLDSTLDPANLAVYPLRTRPLAVGLLAASATGAWPLANLLGLFGVLIGLARGGLGLLTAMLAVPLELLFCITLARFVTASMAGLLRSRRGKDFATFLIIPIFALYEIFAQVVPRLVTEGKITAATFAGMDRWLRWLPPGLAAHAIQDASTGHASTALLRLALLTAVIVILGGLWIRILGRALVTVDTSTQSSAVHGRPLPFARFGVRGTVAGRYLIYQHREPASIIRWCIIAVAMLATSVSSVRTPHYQVALILSAVLGAGMLGAFNSNSIGNAGPGFGLEMAALTGTGNLRAYFTGRNIALAIIAVPLLAAVSVSLAAIAGHPRDAFWAVAIDLGSIGASLALGSIFTATLAYPAEQRVGNPVSGASDGYTGQALAGSFGSAVGVAVAAGPVVAAAELTHSVPAAVRIPALILCAAGYGIILAWAGARIGARTASQRLPELCQIATQSKL